MDRRQQKTRAAIFEALSRLLAEKSYSNISVQEIVERANIGRSTFYAHFETKDDLLREFCSDMFQHVFSDHLMTENTHDFSHHADNHYAVLTHILYHLRDSQKNITGILGCESGELFLQYFKQHLTEYYISKIIAQHGHHLHGVPDAVLINHISGSFINLIQWWIKGGLKETPEELTEYFEAVIRPIMEQ